MTQDVSFSERKILAKKGGKVSVELLNPAARKVAVQVKKLGSPAFQIAKKDLMISLAPKGEHKIIVKFEPDEVKGWPIARNVKHSGLLQIWDKAGKRLIDSVVLEGRGPAFVPALHCLSTSIKKPRKRKSRSPPEIFLETVIPGTSLAVNTGTVEVNWSVDGADTIYLGQGYPGAEVLPDNTVTDYAGWHGPPESSDHGSFSYTPGGSIGVHVIAQNGDGNAEKSAMIYQEARLGYHDATTPAGGSIYESEVASLRGYLDTIEALIRTNRLVNLAEFIGRWNAAAPSGARLPAEFDDMEYLTGPVGTGTLADDMITAMRSMLIYLKPNTLPLGYRPGSVTDPEFHTLCESYGCGGGTCTVYGHTIWRSSHPDRSWVGICKEIGADELTLLHELYHYTTHREGPLEEAKAVAVSWCCFDAIPFD